MANEMKRAPSLGVSLVPVIVLIVSLFFTIVVLEGSGHIPLVLGAIVAAVYALGHPVSALREITSSIGPADVARLIGASETAVYVRHHRAIRKLRQKLPGSLFDELAEGERQIG